jgi:signal transduction histidine kinase
LEKSTNIPDKINLGSAFQMFGNHNSAVEKEEEAYREFYLHSDIKQSKLAMILFAFPLAGFAFNDYMFFGLSNMFFEVISVRIALLALTAFELFFVQSVKKYQTYDKLVFFAILAMLAGGGIINATRPSNFIITSIISIISVFVLYLVVPLKLKYQVLLASVLTVGESLIILVLTKDTVPTVLFTILFSMFAANVVAAFSAWQTHSYRRRNYREFIERKALQDKLEQHANHLSELVEERSKDLLNAQKRLMQSERFAAIGEMAGMVGHDLRNPLAAIKNASYFLRKKQGSFIDDSGSEMLDAIDRSVEHANSIVADLLDFSREIHLELEEFSPKSLVNYVLLAMRFPENIKITQKIQSEPTVWVDANKIERVFTNLVKNAVDAMPKGGTLEISSLQNGENVDFVFSDTGSGISEDVIGKIFTPLFTTKAQGMGFGLAICRRIVEAHGGKISVESVLNKGTTFTISLPIQQPNKKRN